MTLVEEVGGRVSSRLSAVAAVLMGDTPGPVEPPATGDVAALAEELVRLVTWDRGTARIWALLTAAWGFYPSVDQTMSAKRLFQLSTPRDGALWVLDHGLALNPRATAGNELAVVSDDVVVDVGHTATSDLHTGIQKVVRDTLPVWASRHRVMPVGWTRDGRALRTLSDRERRRVLDWEHHDRTEADDVGSPEVVVLPWRTVIVLMELPAIQTVSQLAAMAQLSGNRVVAVGYDCIPVVRADELHPNQATIFTRYLGVLKHARRIAAISRSAAAEFEGFSRAVRPQGIPGPVVVSCPLSCDPPGAHRAAPQKTAGSARGDGNRPDRGPSVLCVGSLDPRKNHLAVLHACEVLWREGLQFSLVLVSGSAWGLEQLARIDELQRAGRPIDLRIEVSDEELEAAYRQARFSLFPSLHEGFGLPVTESLAHGTPVITTNYGGTAEAAVGGGALLIDPRDDVALEDAMRRLLTDDELLEGLRHEAANRPLRTALEYATELWDVLVEPELAAEEAE